MKNRYGIATVTDKNYIKGTEALLYSFLKHNPWFKGDILIIHDQLQDSYQRRLRYFPNTRFVQIDDFLKKKIGYLTNEIPQLKIKSKIFYKLQVFNFTEYNKVLYLDSDILCIGNIVALFEGTPSLKVCQDMSFYQGKVRDKKTYKLVDAKNSSEAGIFEVTFNAGMMLIGKNFLHEKVFHDLIALIDSKKFREIKSGHTDSVILNQYFYNRFELVENIFNYLSINNRINYTNVLMLHYLSHPKPWKLKQIMRSFFMQGRTYSRFMIWYKTYLGYLIQRKKNIN